MRRAEQGNAAHELGAVGRGRARDEIAERVTSDQRGAAAFALDDGRDVARVVVQGDAVHRSRGSRRCLEAAA